MKREKPYRRVTVTLRPGALKAFDQAEQHFDGPNYSWRINGGILLVGEFGQDGYGHVKHDGIAFAQGTWLRVDSITLPKD